MRDYALGTTFDVKFTTRRFSTGAPFTLAGSPVVSAYPDNSTTELTAGITLSVDFDSRTGLHNVRVVATSGNGYAAGSNYALVLTAGTVDSVSVVAEVIGEFSLEAQSPLRPTTAARTLDVSAAGEAGIDWANVGAPTTAQNLSGTNIKTDQVVASVSGAVGSVTGLTASDVGAIKTKTDSLTFTGAGKVDASLRDWLGVAPNALASGRVDSSTGAMAADVVTASAIATDAIGSVELATTAVNEIRDAILSDSTPFAGASVAAIKAKTDNLPTDPADASDIAAAFGTVNSTLGTIAGYVDTEVAAIKAKTDQLTFTVANQVDANALSGGGTGLTAQQTRDAMKLAPTAGSPAVDSIDEELDGIKAKTDNLPASPANETTVAAVKAKTDSLPTDPADASDIAASFSTVNTTLGTIAGYIDTEVAAIKAKTDNLPSDPADQSLVIAATDAIMGRIGVPAGASIAADLAEIEGETDDIAAIKAKTDQLAFTVPGQVDANALTGGGTGLTAQQTRDAMKLAPTAGAPDAGSVDEELDTLDAKLGPITGSGDNNVLGLFQSVMRSDMFPVSSDIGGTYDSGKSLQGISSTTDNIDSNVGNLPPPLTAQQTRDAMEISATGGEDPISSQMAYIKDRVLALVTRELPMLRGSPFAAFEFVMYDSTDHVTPMPGLTVTAERSLDGAAFEPCDNAAAEVSNGVYEIDLTGADNNAKVFTLRFTATGADDALVTILTVPVLI